MFEIIPNWHPIFVHFTVALLSLAVGLFILAPLVKPLRTQWNMVARWALWFGTSFTVLTVLTGLDAYNTVAHDTLSHAAMTDHRSWALVTAGLFLVLTVWSVVRVHRGRPHGALFVAVIVVAGGALTSTAWRGGEVVFRYGLGVRSLPQGIESRSQADVDTAPGPGSVPRHRVGSEVPGGEPSVSRQQEHHDDGHTHTH